VIATNSAMANLWMARREGLPAAWRPFGIVAGLFMANLGFGAWRYGEVEAAMTDPATPHLRTSMIQEGVTMVTRLQDRGDVVLKSWIDLTRKVVAEHPDLVVWPEGSIYGNPSAGRLQQLLSQVAKEGVFHLLLGGGTAEPDPTNVERRLYWNSCYLFTPQGEVQGRYDKMVPLPFGEYLPWPFSYLRDYIEGPGNFRAGTVPHVFSVEGVGAQPVTFSTPICYEAILESQMRRMDDVDLFVNITNDAWFGNTAAPHQHAMLAAVHATELGRPMLRIAYTGVSMTVDPAGVIRDETVPYTDVAEVVDIPLVKFETPYRTWGRAFPWVAAAIGAFAAFRAWRRPPAVTPPPAVA
jgi:apolipoprotein N-acyltransferase